MILKYLISFQQSKQLGGPCSSKPCQNPSDPLSEMTESPYFSATSATFCRVSGNSRPVSAKIIGSFKPALSVTRRVTRLSFPPEYDTVGVSSGFLERTSLMNSTDLFS